MPWRIRKRIRGWEETIRCRIGRKDTDQECRRAHQADGRQEGTLPAEPVADDPENDRAQRPEGESGCEQCERGDEAGGWI